MKGLLKVNKFHNKFEILSSGLRILQISKRIIWYLSNYSRDLIFGKIFGNDQFSSFVYKITCHFIKGHKFHNEFMNSSFLPKYERKISGSLPYTLHTVGI